MSRIDVILPFFNARRHLGEALDSLNQQSFRDWRLVAIDDGSTDGGASAIEAKIDPGKLKLVNLGKNQGIVYALNAGLNEVSGDFIARLDADDLCLPNRFEKQIEYLDSNPEVDVLGTSIIRFGYNSGKMQFPLHDDEIKAELPFFCPIAHPTVMIRASTMNKLKLSYNKSFEWAEDWGLWLLNSSALTFANLPDPLLKYRTHPGSVSQGQKSKHIIAQERILQEFFSKIGFDATMENLKAHAGIQARIPASSIGALRGFEEHLTALGVLIKAQTAVPESVLKKKLEDVWFGYCLSSSELGLRAFVEFFRSSMFKFGRVFQLRFLGFLFFALLRLNNPWKSKWLRPFL